MLSYRAVVNGYDADGNIQFSREAQTQLEFEAYVLQAKQLPGVVSVVVRF
jgi:hypothetical protein